MAESNLDLILRTKREGTASIEVLDDLKEMKKGLTDVEKTMAGTRTTIGGLDKNLSGLGGSVGSLSDAMSGLGLNIPITPMQLFGDAIRLGAQYANDAMGEYADYVDQISKMAAYTSTSTEEMSRLYQIADDLRIPLGDLEMALKSMTDKGTAPSLEGIKLLSEQYLAIQDPLLQAQFLTENFGRAGQEMARLMRMGASGIDEASDAVARWMEVTGKSEEDMEAYRAALDRADEAQQRMAFTVAKDVMPTWTKFMDLLLNVYDLLMTVSGVWHGDPATKKEIEDAFSAFGKQEETPATGGGKAGGGMVYPGTSYKVGEREIETFTPIVPGMITPSGGGGVTVQVYAGNVIGTVDELTAAIRSSVMQVMRDYSGGRSG